MKTPFNIEVALRRFPSPLPLLAVMWFLVSISIPVTAWSNEPKVLVLNSYHKGVRWSDEITSVLEKELAHTGQYQLDVRYLDTKRNPLEGRESHLVRYYQRVFEDENLAAVVAVDNNALAFIKRNRTDLFPETPIVFCGINNYHTDLLDDERWYSGIAEQSAPGETFGMLKHFFPDANRCVVIGDNTTTGQAEMQVARNALGEKRDDTTIEYWSDYTFEELDSLLRTLHPQKDAVILTVSNRDKDGRYRSHRQTGSSVTSHARCPVFGLWDFYLGTGVLGGHMITAQQQGRSASRVVKRILAGQSITDIPVQMGTDKQFLLEIEAMHDSGIYMSSLRHGFMVKDGDQTIYETKGEKTLRLGVLAQRGKKDCQKRWGPTADYLTRHVRAVRFKVEPLGFSEINAAVASKTVDLVVTNPLQLVQLEHRHDVAPLATMQHERLGQTYSVYGGLIFTRSSNSHVKTLDDLVGRSFAAVNEHSLGGWIMARRELADRGIDPFDDFTDLRFLNTHDAVVYAVKEGAFDAGTVRTDTFQWMLDEGAIKPDDFRILNEQKPTEQFPFQRSTRLYSDMPLSALKHVSPLDKERVAGAMITMPPHSRAARAAGLDTWTVSSTYRSVRECMKDLRIAPYQHHERTALLTALKQHWELTLAVIITLLFMVIFSIYMVRMNHKNRKLAEQLSHQRKRLSATLHSIGDGVISADANGEIIDLNEVAEKLTGWKRSEAQGKHLSEIISLYDVSAETPVKNPAIEALRTGEVIYITEDTLLINRHDEEYFITDSAAPIRYNNGEIKGVVMVFRDTTEQTRMRQQIRQSEARLRQYINHAPYGIFIVDSDGSYVFANPSAETLTGYANRELLAMNIEDLAAPDALPDARRVFQNLKQTGEMDNELVIRRKDGERRYFSAKAVQLDSGQYMTFCSDITEQKEAQKKLKKARKREKNIAARIQSTLLLGKANEYIPGVKVASLSVPSQKVDGDFFDTFVHREDCLDIVVGDVMGKGTLAALLGTAAKSTLVRCLSSLVTTSANQFLPAPDELMNALRAQMAHELINLESFITLFYARIRTDSQSLQWVSCGHTPTIHYQANNDQCHLLTGENAPLGFMSRESYSQTTTRLGPGDLIVSYSDGITEARNPRGDMFGKDRLIDLVSSMADESPHTIINSVREAVHSFARTASFADDLTCVIAKIEGTDALPPSKTWRNSYTTTPQNLSTMRHDLRNFIASQYGDSIEQEDVNMVLLAVNEVATNVMQHAFHGDTTQTIHVRADANNDRLTVTLAHSGDAFMKAYTTNIIPHESQGSGYGLHIIHNAMDTVHYSRDEEDLNCIRMTKFFNEARQT